MNTKRIFKLLLTCTMVTFSIDLLPAKNMILINGLSYPIVYKFAEYNQKGVVSNPINPNAYEDLGEYDPFEKLSVSSVGLGSTGFYTVNTNKAWDKINFDQNHNPTLKNKNVLLIIVPGGGYLGMSYGYDIDVQWGEE